MDAAEIGRIDLVGPGLGARGIGDTGGVANILARGQAETTRAIVNRGDSSVAV